MRWVRSEVEQVEKWGVLKVRLSGVDWKPAVTPDTQEHRFIFIGAEWAGSRAELAGRRRDRRDQQAQGCWSSEDSFKVGFIQAPLTPRRDDTGALGRRCFLRHPQVSCTLQPTFTPQCESWGQPQLCSPTDLNWS